MAQSSNHPATRNTWGQSPVITRQTCAPANITFLQCTLQTWDAEQQLCQFFVYGRFQTTPCNMLLHNQVLAFISLSWLWKRNMTNIFQQKEQCMLFQSMLQGVHVYTYIHAYIKIISKGERNIQEHEQTVWQKTTADYVQIKPTSCVMPWCSFAFQGIQQHCKPKFFSLRLL